MGKKLVFLTLIFTFLFGTFASAHPGRTDSNGGHTCWTNCSKWGLKTGEYHTHNGGSATSNSSSSTNINDKDCTDFADYDEMVAYWNSKGYSATYDPENLDGWGNGKVDDGIPCEAPEGYDLTKINNSPQQKEYKADQEDRKSGLSQGRTQGLKDGYQEAKSNKTTAKGTAAYQEGYRNGYNSGYKDGEKKLKLEKTKATNNGYTLGKKQDKIVIPSVYASHSGLKKAFEDGFNKAVSERIEVRKKEFNSLGYNDGKKNVYSPPKDEDKIYIIAYQEGYTNGQKKLRDEYTQLGYEAAFTMLKYKDPALTNKKFKAWYKQGFDSNKEITKIKNAGLFLGQQGSTLKVPAKYKKSEVIFKHYYNKGLKEYKEQQRDNQKAAAGGAGVIALIWLGRRFYVARKMIK